MRTVLLERMLRYSISGPLLFLDQRGKRDGKVLSSNLEKLPLSEDERCVLVLSFRGTQFSERSSPPRMGLCILSTAQ